VHFQTALDCALVHCLKGLDQKFICPRNGPDHSSTRPFYSTNSPGIDSSPWRERRRTQFLACQKAMYRGYRIYLSGDFFLHLRFARGLDYIVAKTGLTRPIVVISNAICLDCVLEHFQSALDCAPVHRLSFRKGWTKSSYALEMDKTSHYVSNTAFGCSISYLSELGLNEGGLR